MDIVDAHIHIWRKEDPGLLTINKPHFIGNYEAIRRDYTITHLLSDASGAAVKKFVYVQTNWAEDRSLEETRWVQKVADEHGYPNAIVGYADLRAPNVEQMLRKQIESPLFRGTRTTLNWHDSEPLYRSHRAGSDMMRDARFLHGMGVLQKLGLSFDIQVLPHQLGDAEKLVRDFPNMTFVLDHAGLPHDRSSSGMSDWKRGMHALARLPNVFVKLSGLSMFTHECSLEAIQPIVDKTIECFGANRTMLGSNFPIEKLWTSYSALMDIFRESLRDLTSDERASVLHGAAITAYRLQ